jgi:hypothetical protein
LLFSIRIFLLTTCFFFFAWQVKAQSNPQFQIIPQPKQIESTNSNFVLKKNTRLALANSRSTNDRFAAQDFIDDVKQTAKANVGIGSGKILIGLIDHPRLKKGFEKANLEIPANLNDEGYAIVVNADQIIVGGKTEVGTFYGLQTLKQMVRGSGDEAYVQGARIVDYPTMRYRAFSDDISRGLVPTLDYVKRQIKTFAMFKMNMHSLYMEHTFASQEHPLFAPEEGSFNAAELREIVEYAQKYHVEIVPEQQGFGHLHKVLKFEKYNRLSEVPYGDVITPQEPGSYQLVADLYKEIDRIFPSEFFHIGADETFELGQGRSQSETKEKGVGAVYFQHINRVREILKPYNRRLMMWGDIALNHPDLIGNIEKDMIVMNWQYAARDSYVKSIEPFQKAGLEQFVCPSVWNFNQIFPNNENAVVNIRNFVRDGQAAGALGVMNTSWDDDGETLFEMTWYGVVLGAAAGWESAPLDAEKFDQKFDWAFFRAEGNDFTRGIRTLGAANKTLGFNNITTNALFWQNPFTANFQKRSRESIEKAKQLRLDVETVEESLIKNNTKANRNREMIPAMHFAAERFDHLGRRLILLDQFSQAYWDAYLNMSDRRRVRNLSWYSGAIYNYLREMAEELAELKRKYRALYLAENKLSHVDSVLARYDQSIQIWLNKSQQLNQALIQYNETKTLPKPDEIGLMSGPADEGQVKTN